MRLLHWVLVVLVSASWFTGGRTGRLGEWHELLGYGLACLLSVRVVWGVVGSPYARFRQFVRAPIVAWRYLLQVFAGGAPRYLGHNPLGGWMVVALMGCLGALALSGWLYTTEWLWGYEWLYRLHFVLGWVLVGLVALHLAGVAFTSWQHRENLVRAMFTGFKRSAAPGDEA